jgi:ABC-2 type transport system permease protein
MAAIIKRELKSYFTSVLGYVILAILFLFTGLYVNANIFSYGYADMYYVFNPMVTIIFFVVPILTMRLLSEEKRQKTDQLLLTSPINVSSIVFGKYIAAVLFFSVFLVLTFLYNIVLSFVATPSWSQYFGNVIGMLLFASSLISIGLFISSLTESQVVAAVGSFAVSMILMLLDTIGSTVNQEWFTKFVEWVSFSGRYETFTKGILDLSNVVFFLSIIAIFLFLTIRVLDRKRWA